MKDFASDKKVEDIFSYCTMKKIEEAMIEGQATGLIEDCGALAVTMFFLRLHLQAMNARLEVSHCRAMYLWMSMIFLTSLTGVNITPKRNMVSETISNMFIVMHSAILATAPVNRLSMDSETLRDPSVNSPVQTLHLMTRRNLLHANYV